MLVWGLVACGGRGEHDVEPAPPVAPVAQPAAEPEPEAETETGTEADPVPEAETETVPAPDPPSEPPEPAVTPQPRTKRASLRDSYFCRRARARDATETVCDAEGNCNSPGVPPQCR